MRVGERSEKDSVVGQSIRMSKVAQTALANYERLERLGLFRILDHYQRAVAPAEERILDLAKRMRAPSSYLTAMLDATKLDLRLEELCHRAESIPNSAVERMTRVNALACLAAEQAESGRRAETERMLAGIAADQRARKTRENAKAEKEPHRIVIKTEARCSRCKDPIPHYGNAVEGVAGDPLTFSIDVIPYCFRCTPEWASEPASEYWLNGRGAVAPLLSMISGGNAGDGVPRGHLELITRRADDPRHD